MAKQNQIAVGLALSLFDCIKHAVLLAVGVLGIIHLYSIFFYFRLQVKCLPCVIQYVAECLYISSLEVQHKDFQFLGGLVHLIWKYFELGLFSLFHKGTPTQPNIGVG